MFKKCLLLFLSSLLIFLDHAYCQESNSEIEKTGSINEEYPIEGNRKFQKWAGAKYRLGWVLQTNDYVKGYNPDNLIIESFHAIDLKLGWQTTGTKDWHSIYNNPYYGIGFYNASFVKSDALGYPTALYFFWGGPLKRWGRHSINYNWAFGLSWNWDPFDPVDYNQDIVLGSHRNFFIDMGFEYVYELSSTFDLAGGIYLTHFSNGAIKTPNVGLGLPAPSVELRYNIGSRITTATQKKPKYIKEDELYLLVAYGAKQLALDSADYNSPYFDETFSVISLSGAWLHGFSHYIKGGIGADFSYDNSMRATLLTEGIIEEEDNLQESDKSVLGVFGTAEFIFHRISVITALGAYLYNREVPDIKPRLYQRLGIKYHISNSFFVGVSVKAYDFSTADHVEWSLGCRLKWER